MDSSRTSDQSLENEVYPIKAFFAYTVSVINPIMYNRHDNPNWKQAMPVLPKDLKEMKPNIITQVELGVPAGRVPERAKCSHIKEKGECSGTCYIIQMSPEHPHLAAAAKQMENNDKTFREGEGTVLARKYHGGNHLDKIYIDDECLTWLINIEGWEELYNEVVESAAKLSALVARKTG